MRDRVTLQEENTLEVSIENGKYTICGNFGNLWVERNGEPWLGLPGHNASGCDAWLAVAFELYCLRRIVRLAIEKLGSDSDMAALLKELDGLTDYRSNLSNPGKV